MRRESREKPAPTGSIRRPLPRGGVLSIDRSVPFLFVHRPSPGTDDDATPRLISGEASFLVAGRARDDIDEEDDAGGEVRSTIRDLAHAGSEAYGGFLLIELWTGDEGSRRFVVRGPKGPAPETVDALVKGLGMLEALHPAVETAFEATDTRHPPGLAPILSVQESWESGILVVGVEIPAIYRAHGTRQVDSRFLRRLQRGLSRVLRQAAYEFIRVQTRHEVDNYHALGTRTLREMVWIADQELSAVERCFDLLLLASPVNLRQAWRRFRDADFGEEPEFHYRLLPTDPDQLKRRLFSIRLEDIDDPALASLFQDKREELDTRLGMLAERGTPGFRFSSMRLYGTVDQRLLDTARSILAAVPPPAPEDDPPGRWVDANGFREAAKRELAAYAGCYPEVSSSIEVRPDVVGLLVSEGDLLIGEGLRLDPDRVEALVHHEVGTHMLTYVNGSAQPLEQLCLGLAGYDELQEGLAVLAEFLVGGLDRARMRLLAGRVVAAHCVEQGANFTETFAALTGDLGFTPGTAWHVAVRVHQCGGFTRDLIYLRGLVRLLEHLREGGDLVGLYVGKIAQKHIPIVEELRYRRVLREPPLTPRFLEFPTTASRLDRVRGGLPLVDMIRGAVP